MEIGGFERPHSGAAAADTQLLAGVGQMGLDRRLGDVQTTRDLVRLEVFGDTGQAGSFTSSKSDGV